MIEFKNVTKTYDTGTEAVHNASFTIDKGEFAFLVAHSMLHLLGYDHMTPEDEKKMFTKQESVLQYLSILR